MFFSPKLYYIYIKLYYIYIKFFSPIIRFIKNKVRCSFIGDIIRFIKYKVRYGFIGNIVRFIKNIVRFNKDPRGPGSLRSNFYFPSYKNTKKNKASIPNGKGYYFSNCRFSHQRIKT